MDELQLLHEQLKCRLDNLETLISYQKRIEYNEQEIDIRFESLNLQIDKKAEKLERRFRKLVIERLDVYELLKESSVDDVESGFRRSLRFFKGLNDLQLVGKKQILKNQVGHFKYYCDYNRVRNVKTVDLNVNEAGQMAAVCNSSQILLPNYMNSTLNIVDMKGQLIKTMHLRELWYPKAVCTNGRNRIIVSNLNNLLVFDEKFTVLKKIENEHGQCITIDHEEPNILYVCNFFENSIRVFNLESNERTREVQIEAPMSLTTRFGRLYVSTLSLYECETRNNIKKVTALKDESNCITVLNKETLETLKVIKSQHWLHPRCVQIDSDENIIVLAFKLNENREVSEYRWLFILNLYGEIIQEIYLSGIVEFQDALFIEKLLIVCGFDVNADGYKKYWIKFIEIE